MDTLLSGSRLVSVTVLVALLLLSGCSSSSDSPTAPPPPSPADIQGFWEGLFGGSLYIAFQFDQTGGGFTGTVQLGPDEDDFVVRIMGTVNSQGEVQWEQVNLVCLGGVPIWEGDLQVTGNSASGVATFDTRDCVEEEEDLQFLVVDTVAVSRDSGGSSAAVGARPHQEAAELARILGELAID